MRTILLVHCCLQWWVWVTAVTQWQLSPNLSVLGTGWSTRRKHAHRENMRTTYKKAEPWTGKHLAVRQEHYPISHRGATVLGLAASSVAKKYFYVCGKSKKEKWKKVRSVSSHPREGAKHTYCSVQIRGELPPNKKSQTIIILSHVCHPWPQATE